MKENDEKRNKQEQLESQKTNLEDIINTFFQNIQWLIREIFFPFNKNENDKLISPTKSPNSVIREIEERNRKVNNIMDLEKWLKEEEERKKKFQEKIAHWEKKYKKLEIFGKNFPKLMKFKDQYSNTIPEKILSSTSEDKYYKVRSTFWQWISFAVENLWTYDLLSTELFIEFKKIMEQRKEHLIENDLTRPEDITAINELIEKIIVFIDEKKYRLKYPPQDWKER